MGELELMPDQFWSLTFREFNIKWEAFARREDRALALVIKHAAMVGQYSDKHRRSLQRAVSRLKRYPLKRWLSPEPPQS